MAHVYATVDHFKDFVKDSGSASSGGLGTSNDTQYLRLVEASSRTVDAFCDRSRFGSGFGPRTASNRYDSDGRWYLELNDDFLTISSVSALAGTAGASTALVEDTDYYTKPYNRAQKRGIQIVGLTSGVFYAGWRDVTVAGTAGYQNTTRASTATAGVIASTSVTTFTIGGTDDLQVGMTLLVDSEQLYLRAKAGTTATIDRGANGTTAATHLVGAAISYYIYPSEVVDATVSISLRRWRSRDAGSADAYAYGQIPGSPPATEMAILNRTVGHLKVIGVG